jgi:capsular polysaccharide biosynthesis protein
VESVTILRDLWSRRILVALVALVAIAIGFVLTYYASFPPQRRSYNVGVATASVLVDTPRSQVVEVDPKGSESLANRANVLANLMVDGEIKNVIVGRAGLEPKQVIASSDSPGNTEPPPPLEARSRAYMTSVALTSDMSELPIIRVRTQAPDVAQAIKLANAAVEGLSAYLDSKAADEAISDSRRLRVRALGTAQGHAATRGPSRVLGVAVAIFVFLAGCALILALSALIRGWRAAVALEQDFGALDASAFSGNDAFEDADWPANPDESTKLRAS